MSEISGSKDNVMAAATKATVTNPSSITDVTAFPPGAPPARSSQQTILPAAVGQRLLGSLVTSSASGLGNGSFIKFTISAGTSASYLFTIADNQGRTILAVPDIAVYIDRISAATQWPNATYGMASMPVSVFNDWGQTDNVNVVTRVTVRNNLVADTVVIAVCRWRIITNAVADLTQADASSGQLLSSSTGLFGGLGGH